MTVNRRAVLLATSILTTGINLSTELASAQDLSDGTKDLLNNPFIQPIDLMLASWNVGTLQFSSKQKLLPVLEKKLARAVEAHAYPYHTDQWANSTLTAFEKFPDQLETKLPLSETSRLMLVVSGGINLPFLQDRIKNPDEIFSENSIPNPEIELSSFIILANAQELAIQRGSKTIDPEDIIHTQLAWWSRIWPFSVFH